MQDAFRSLANVWDKDALTSNLSAIALYVGIYEQMVDVVVERVESFLCSDCHLDEAGRFKNVHNDKYKSIILKRVIDDKGNRDQLKSTILWFVEAGAITKADYDLFLELKALRHKYVHEMTDCLLNGLGETDAQRLVQLYNLFYKIDNWWVNEIEIPAAGDEIKAGYDADGCMSVILELYNTVFGVLYNEKSQEYMSALNDATESK